MIKNPKHHLSINWRWIPFFHNARFFATAGWRLFWQCGQVWTQCWLKNINGGRFSSLVACKEIGAKMKVPWKTQCFELKEPVEVLQMLRPFRDISAELRWLCTRLKQTCHLFYLHFPPSSPSDQIALATEYPQIVLWWKKCLLALSEAVGTRTLQ